MAHFTRTQSTGTWTTGSYVTLASDWSSLDAKVFASINGDKGGSWTPTSQLRIESPGALPQGGLVVSGPLLVAYGGSLTTKSSARFGIAGATAWPKFASGHIKRSRKILNTSFRFQTREMFFWKHVLGMSTEITKLAGIQSPFCSFQAASGTIFSPSFHMPLRVHASGKLSKATFTFRVPSIRTKKPEVMPKFRIIRTDLEGNIQPLKSTASGADADGYISPTAPDSGDAWYNEGLPQTFEYECDQNNVIDVSQYMYWAQVIEEAGAKAPIPGPQIDGIGIVERKDDCYCVFTHNQPLTGNPLDSIGGTIASIPSGNRLLLVSQTVPQQNGIWILDNGGAWTRAADLLSIANFTPNFIVGAQRNATLDVQPQFWQISTPQQPQVATIKSDNTGSPIQFLRVGRTPPTVWTSYTPSSPLRGNIYHSVVVTIDDIVDMRPQ